MFVWLEDFAVVLCRLDYWTQCELIKCGEYFHISFQPPAPAPAPHRYSVWCVMPEYCTPGCRRHISTTDKYPPQFILYCIGFFIATLHLYFLQILVQLQSQVIHKTFLHYHNYAQHQQPGILCTQHSTELWHFLEWILMCDDDCTCSQHNQDYKTPAPAQCRARCKMWSHETQSGHHFSHSSHLCYDGGLYSKWSV